MEEIGSLIYGGVGRRIPQVISRRDYTQKYSYLDVLGLIEDIGKRLDSGFKIDKYNRFAYVNIAKWIVGDSTMECLDITGKGRKPGKLTKGIFLTGKTGTGKSMIMEIGAQVARDLRLGYTAGHSTCSLAWNCFRSDNIVSYYAQGGSLGLLTEEQRSLCIQDLGSEPTEASYMGTRVSVLRQIIEARSDNRTQITHYTSNLSLRDRDKLTERYGDRVYDRLRECNYLEIAGESRRG